jgi:hypothetical protein
MHGLALALLGLTLSADPVEVAHDVEEINTLRFAFPLMVDPDRREKIERIELYVSTDRGCTWKLHSDSKPTAKSVLFNAPRDGLYLFALRVVFVSGKSEPEELGDLVPQQKVYVNSKQLELKRRPPKEEAGGQIEVLRK